jgi:hypothetical protein
MTRLPDFAQGVVALDVASGSLVSVRALGGFTAGGSIASRRPSGAAGSEYASWSRRAGLQS